MYLKLCNNHPEFKLQVWEQKQNQNLNYFTLHWL